MKFTVLIPPLARIAAGRPTAKASHAKTKHLSSFFSIALICDAE
jgi:hypothetical protein